MKGKRAKDSIFKNVIFVALAASGKSEALTFIKKMPPEQRVRDLHIGREIVVLDDFSYVDLMKAIDKVVVEHLKLWPIFFAGPDKPFLEPAISWKLLILLLNQDYERIISAQKKEEETARHLLARIDAAREQLQAKPLFFNPDCEPLIGRINFSKLCQSLKEKVSGLEQIRKAQIPKNLEETTILIEFARGGHFHAKPPLPYAYADSFSILHPAILQQAAFLYLEVLPEQAALKNFLRADPKDPSSILGHCVPYEVMFRDYGSDDFRHLLKISEKPGFIAVETISRKKFFIPAAILDNKADLTTFVRQCQDQPFDRWPKEEKMALGQALKKACQELWKHYQ